MKQVNELMVLGLCATLLPRGLTPLLLVTEKICSAGFLDIMYVCHLTFNKKLGSLVGFYINSKKRSSLNFSPCVTDLGLCAA